MMITKTETGNYPWRVNPFEKIAGIWSELVESAKLAIPHAVGTIRLSNGAVVDLELQTVLHEDERSVVVSEGDEVHFLLPVDPAEGPEGLYVRLVEALGMRV